MATSLAPQPLEPGLPQPIPVGTAMDLGGGRTIHVRVGGPDAAEATPVVLLHGLTASAGLNWMHLFGPLSRQRMVIAPDLRGHGRGVQAPRRYEMADNADDVADLLAALGVDRVVVVGFSMGGAVAQELARRHPDLVEAVVLHATSTSFRMAPIGKRLYGVNPWLARLATVLPGRLREALLARTVKLDDPTLRQFVISETRRHRSRSLIRAADALSRFRSETWVGELTQPAAVVVAGADRSLSPRLQHRLADLLASRPQVDTHVSSTDRGHSGVLWNPDAVVPVLVDAITAVSPA